MEFQCVGGLNGKCFWESSLRRILETNWSAFAGDVVFIYECAKDLRFDRFSSPYVDTKVYFNPSTHTWEFLRVICQGCGQIVVADYRGQILMF